MTTRVPLRGLLDYGPRLITDYHVLPAAFTRHANDSIDYPAFVKDFLAGLEY